MALRIALKRSRRLAGVIAGAHIAAALLLLPLHVPLWATSIAGALIALSLAVSLYQHALLLSSRSIVKVELRDDAGAAVLTRDGAWHEVRVLGTTCVTPMLTVLNLRECGRFLARHVVLLPDSACAEDLRALRVTLRWSRHKAR